MWFFDFIQKIINLIYALLEDLLEIWKMQFWFDHQARSNLEHLCMLLVAGLAAYTIVYPTIFNKNIYVNGLIWIVAIVVAWLIRVGLSDPTIYRWLATGHLIQLAMLFVGGFILNGRSKISFSNKLYNLLGRPILIAGASSLLSFLSYLWTTQDPRLDIV